MCIHANSVTVLPLFIILPNSIQNLPDELNEFVENRQPLFVSLNFVGCPKTFLVCFIYLN